MAPFKHPGHRYGEPDRGDRVTYRGAGAEPPPEPGARGRLGTPKAR
ncbi:hypothetical protein GCM10022284_37830 [Streptomyces hundungensis]